MPWRENKGVANLDGIYTDFIELLRKKSLGEIFFKMLLRKKYCGFAVYLQTKSLTKIFDQNTQQYVALQEGFLGDRIGDARNLNENLKENL